MENESKKLRELRYKINALRKRNVKQVQWVLTKTERKYIEELLGKENVVPFIYNIKTKSFQNINSVKSSIVREVHYKYKAGKKTFGRHIKKKEFEELRTYGVEEPEPVKFIIYL